ncbi:MAG: D-alanyl-D-alanine carboxypeptidase, partial [Acidobacteriota bacterium]
MRKCLLALVALLVVVPSHGQDFPTFAEKAIAEPPFDRAIWAIRVEEDDGTPVYSRNAHTLMLPASNRKLFAASTVANCLGWDARLQTELWLDGEDLVLRGGGDPSLGGRYYDSPALALDPFIRAVRGRGLRTIRDVVADVSLFDRVTIPGSWKVGNLPYKYAAPVDSLTYAENVNGEAAVVEPGLFAAQSLRDALSFAGITVTGTVRLCAASCNASGLAERLAAIRSPYVSQLLSTVLENSQNLYTETLLKDLSMPRNGPLMTPPPPAAGSPEATTPLSA